MIVHGGANRCQTQSVLANAMEKLHDKRQINGRGYLERTSLAFRDPRHMFVGCASLGARGQRFVRQAPQVLEQRQLQHAGPRPELADRQRRHALVAVQESDQLLPIQTAVAMSENLQRDGVDARLPEVLP